MDAPEAVLSMERQNFFLNGYEAMFILRQQIFELYLTHSYTIGA